MSKQAYDNYLNGHTDICPVGTKRSPQYVKPGFADDFSKQPVISEAELAEMDGYIADNPAT